MFHRGGRNHFSNRGHTRKDIEVSTDMDTAKTQTTETSTSENKEGTSQDSTNCTRLENGEDPLSLVLDGCSDNENETGKKLDSPIFVCS